MSARIIDSHTGGEPTRVVVGGGPDLGTGPLAERRDLLRREHDAWRRALCNEPRGNDVIVGALLVAPHDPRHDAGVIFFNNVGMLGMCGHGTIGLVATLSYLGRARPGRLSIETPVGLVHATLEADGSVTVANVPAYCHAQRIALDVPGLGRVHGDVAWGGNWFFLCDDHGLEIAPAHLARLTEASQAVRDALAANRITGAQSAEIDHIELLGPARDGGNHGRGFVLCPGGAYDRSPCGTGTSAKLACLAAHGQLAPGQRWRQESVIGSVFEAHYQAGPAREDGMPQVLPFIRGRAHVTLDATVVFDRDDPFAWGLTAA